MIIFAPKLEVQNSGSGCAIPARAWGLQAQQAEGSWCWGAGRGTEPTGCSCVLTPALGDKEMQTGVCHWETLEPGNPVWPQVRKRFLTPLELNKKPFPSTLLSALSD